MRVVKHIMGMPISIDVPSAKNPSDLKAAFDTFTELDELCSTYKDTSEVSRYNRGEISKFSPRLQAIADECRHLEKISDGYFSAWYNKIFDPSGLVKALAIQEAADKLDGHGFTKYMINAAGDLYVKSPPETPWSIAIQNPVKKSADFGDISMDNGAVATSGTYERGNHIVNPKTGKPQTDIVSITVVGPDIIAADVLATTAVAMGIKKAPKLFENQKKFMAVVVDTSGNVQLLGND